MARYTYGKTKKYRLPMNEPRGDAPRYGSRQASQRRQEIPRIYMEDAPIKGERVPKKRRKSGDRWIG